VPHVPGGFTRALLCCCARSETAKAKYMSLRSMLSYRLKQ
jgi:hypothetical protein